MSTHESLTWCESHQSQLCPQPEIPLSCPLSSRPWLDLAGDLPRYRQ